jgi:hypothetical protein
MNNLVSRITTTVGRVAPALARVDEAIVTL